MNKPLKVVLAVVSIALLAIGGGYGWATMRSTRLRTRTIEAHRVDFPIPFPLSDEERAALGPGEDPQHVAMDRAVARGRHLVNSRYACIECHGADFSGGVMLDDPMIGTLFGPNLTMGRGSKTSTYQPSDWDRIVRHGVAQGGRPAVMPSEDFFLMSDQELSDIVAYLRSMPAVDNEMPAIRLGPLGTVLVATGSLRFAADLAPSHTADHVEMPPATEASVDFGRHLAGVCSSCHHPDFSGGPIAGGDPSWVPSGNLTPHEDGLAAWSYDDFVTAMTAGKRPDGTDLRLPMTLMLPYAGNMTDVEMQALWTFLQSLPPVASTE